MPVKAWREKDDGYRGLLKNPETGRIFKANAVTARRTDLIRITDPDEDPIVETSRDDDQPDEPTTAKVEPEESGPTAEELASEANDALDGIVNEATESEDKAKLIALGAQVGVKLTKNMNVETMRERITTQVETIKAAGG